MSETERTPLEEAQASLEAAYNASQAEASHEEWMDYIHLAQTEALVSIAESLALKVEVAA